jgi:hypothetical protein
MENDILYDKIHKLLRKDNFYDFLLTNEEMRNLFIKNIENTQEFENFFEEEIVNIVKANLKHSK